MRIGVISSGNGGAFKAFFSISKLMSQDVLLLTDRECGIEVFADINNIKRHRIIDKENKSFSKKCKAHIDSFDGVDIVFLFYTRLVTEELFDSYPLVNFHPSILPAYKGFSSIKRALKDGVKFIGTTMHSVSIDIDGGKILAQSCYPLTGGEDEEYLEKISFMHKVYFMCLFEELLIANKVKIENNIISFEIESKSIYGVFNPSINSKKLIEELKALYEKNMTL